MNAARSMRLVTWNLERKKPHTPTGSAAVERISREEPELVVVTEARTTHLQALGGYEITSQPPAGERFASDERKVLGWSRNPWREVDQVGYVNMPAGRFVAGTTDTSIGEVRVIAICVPWHMCDVRTGPKDRKPWEQHLRWLEEFGRLINEPSTIPTVIAGDFNQRVPARPRSPKKVTAALASIFETFDIITAGVPPGCDQQGIDHIAIDRRLEYQTVQGWPHNDGGVRMSDHDAAMADLTLR